MRLVLTRAVTETRSDRGVLSWVGGGGLRVAHTYDPFGAALRCGETWPAVLDAVTIRAMRNRRAAAGPWAAPAGALVDTAATYQTLRHILVVPVRIGDDDVAVLGLTRRRDEPFGDADIEAGELVAQVAAPALRGARLLEELAVTVAAAGLPTSHAERLERAKSDLLRLASHELRTPLTILNGYVDLIRAGSFGTLPPPLEDVMAILAGRTADINALINSMLAAARVEDAPDPVTASLTDLRELVREALRPVQARASDRHSIRLELPDQPVEVPVDVEQVLLAIRNLVDNAVKYSPDGGDVVCRLTVAEGRAVIEVTDEGLGVAAADRERLFTRFGRIVNAENSHIRGVGLGLYLSRQVLRRHGGDVVLLANDRPRGSAFCATLPLGGPSS